jgi:rod shape-determining protein MreC
MRPYLKYYIACGVFLVLGWFGALEPLRYEIHALLNPVQFGLYSTYGGLREFAGFFASLKSIREENSRLSDEVEKLQSQLVMLKEVQMENTVLKKELSIGRKASDPNLVEARVTSFRADSESSEIALDVGSLSGVKMGASVVLNGSLVGKVVEVEPHKSLAELITSPKFSVGVLDMDSPSKSKGVVLGVYGTSLVMDKILQDETITPGDSIVTSGQDSAFRFGLLVGRVESVVGKDTEPVKKAKISPFINFSGLSIVFVEVWK